MIRSATLTARQMQVLAFVKDRQRDTGMVPTIQETATHFGFKSLNSAREHFRLIEKKGFIHRVPGRSRGLVVVRPEGAGDQDSARVPLLGRIPAGHPVLAHEDTEALLTLPAGMFHGGGLFALRVRGTSMEGVGILDGDIAVLDSMKEVKDGAIAAILIEDEATLKHVYRRPEGLLLKAENPMFRDIEVPPAAAERARVLGALVGVVRKV
ncbi:transcriptional repressor LexA [Paludibaculum fermentans]|uniref:LexA repressor n=1 Tax=Paludibaculum fermentans TaxID=1473598 RepID=A0A7S7SMY8_PALFE|nr:transcriptional repressor LexA [Paludibaculum fermentans]QOY91822.1 transcriptional repressor LexA [Paludibaculum fermentans]